LLFCKPKAGSFRSKKFTLNILSTKIFDSVLLIQAFIAARIMQDKTDCQYVSQAYRNTKLR